MADQNHVPMKKFSWLLFCIVFPCFLIAQKNIRKAILVTSTGDSVNALINDREWHNNPTEVTVRTYPDEIVRTYTAEQLQSVFIENGARYFIVKVKVDITPSEFQTSFLDPQLIKSEESLVFLLQEFSNNNLSLYSLQANGRLHLYIRKDRGIPEELIYRNLTLVRNGSPFDVEDRSYVRQLDSLLSDCDKLTNEINPASGATRYTISSIRKLLQNYQRQCGGPLPAYVRQNKARGKASYFVSAGTTINNVRFKGGNVTPDNRSDLITKNPLKADPSFSAGITFQYVLPVMKQKLGFLFSAYYNSFKASGTEYKTYLSGDLYEEKTLTVNPTLLRSGLLTRYYISNRNLRPYLQAGFIGSFVLSHKDELILDDYYGGEHHVTSNDQPYGTFQYKKLQLGFAFGAGLQYGRICLDYKFEPTSGYLNSMNIRSHVIANTIMIGFRLN